MEIIKSDEELNKYMHEAVHVSNNHPVLIDSYLTGRECEIDALSDGKDVYFQESLNTSKDQEFIQGILWQSIRHKIFLKMFKNK
jgi:Phosphoribosylamine-glycine ligase